MVFGLTWAMLIAFAVAVVTQIVGIGLLAKTAGFTNIGYSAAVVALYGISLAAMARLVNDGAPLGVLIPIMATVIPLASIAIGVAAHGESASPVKVGLLVLACAIIGTAARY